MPIGYSLKPSGLFDRLYRWISKTSSRYSGGAEQLPPPEAMAGYLKAQRLAYAAVQHVGKLLHVGMTEQQAAELLEAYLREHGTERYLHRAFAWFGEHSRFDGYQDYADYHPSSRALRAEDVAILDVSPVVDGYIGDVGYALSLTPNPELDRAKDFLLQLRDDIPKMFASEMTAAAIWAEIDQRIQAAGFDNVHAKYPHCVLGHRVFRVKPKQGKHLRVGTRSFGWFSLETNLTFLKLGLSAALTPEHIGNKLGLWAIEPHIGFAGGGCKFEEVLVVEPHGVYWLDNEVPHVIEAREKRT
ncbi:MAG: M24 family metallopeptidase [Pseudomonas sp.]|uniref:M24 family metallopeptidase n=1 Tax=Pseudomonas sp. TaxID=306 RepID=UPI0030F136BB